jgi:GT2 family glycosyltransferase
MDTLHLALVALAWAIALAWLAKLIEAARGLRRVANLTEPRYDVMPAGDPTVTVIVPARNEAAGVAACVGSLLRQDYSRMRVVAVDDRSTDATGEILDGLAREHSNQLEVLHVTALPQGWLGKTHAMAMAARHAMAKNEPDYLLFTDGDVVFREDALRRTLAQAIATEADHFVAMPTTLVRTFGEGMLLAYLQVMALWAVRVWRAAEAGDERDAIGVGAFNLMRTRAYRELGGFDAMPMEILEDLYLGRRVKRAGMRQRVATAPGMVCVHWAAGATGILNGMTKNIFAVFRFRPVLLVLAAAGLAVSGVGPAALLLVAGARVPALVAWGSAAGLYVILSRTNRISAGYSGLFPVAAGLVAYAMLRSMVTAIRRGGVTWRGTFYSLTELRSHADGDFRNAGAKAGAK